MAQCHVNLQWRLGSSDRESLRFVGETIPRNHGERTRLRLNVHLTGRASMITFAQKSDVAVAKVNLMSKK
jgi:hypothetical protein